MHGWLLKSLTAMSNLQRTLDIAFFDCQEIDIFAEKSHSYVMHKLCVGYNVVNLNIYGDVLTDYKVVLKSPHDYATEGLCPSPQGDPNYATVWKPTHT